MALGFILMAVIFIFSFSGGYRLLELGITASMLILAALAQLDRKRFIFYELPFIYLSHFSVLVAAVALK